MEKGYYMTESIITAIIVALCTLLLQKSFANVVSGINIKIMKPFKKGDKVSIKRNSYEIASGYISKVGFTHVKIKTYNRDMYILSNSSLDDCVIINSNIKAGVNHIEHICITTDSDIEEAKRIIKNLLVTHAKTENTAGNTDIIVKYEPGQIVIQYNVRTKTVDESYQVCSGICSYLIDKFNKTERITLV